MSFKIKIGAEWPIKILKMQKKKKQRALKIHNNQKVTLPDRGANRIPYRLWKNYDFDLKQIEVFVNS